MAITPDNAYVSPSHSDVEVVQLRARVAELEAENAQSKVNYDGAIDLLTDYRMRLAVLEAKLPAYTDNSQHFVPGVDVVWVNSGAGTFCTHNVTWYHGKWEGPMLADNGPTQRESLYSTKAAALAAKERMDALTEQVNKHE